MDILRQIYTAKSDYKATSGRQPKVLKVCPETHMHIKSALYPQLSSKLDALPLTFFDGMSVELDEAGSGWEFSNEKEETDPLENN